MTTKHRADAGKIDVAYVAHLARIHLDESEVASFQGQLEEVVKYVEQLRELDVDGIEPTAHAVRVESVLRPDQVTASLDRDRVMNNAPESKGGQFVVPRIIE